MSRLLPRVVSGPTRGNAIFDLLLAHGEDFVKELSVGIHFWVEETHQFRFKLHRRINSSRCYSGSVLHKGRL